MFVDTAPVTGRGQRGAQDEGLFPTVLFDESHSEAWTIRPEVAAKMNPSHPDDSGYVKAAAALRAHGHTVVANVDTSLDQEALDRVDVLVLAHPSESDWERTTGSGSPVLTETELDAIEQFVRRGGGLVVLGESEQGKYGNNLNELLLRFGILIENRNTLDVSHNFRDVAAWVLAEPVPEHDAEDLLAGVGQACFYRAGALRVQPESAGRPVLRTHASADPAGAPLAAVARVDQGRVIAFADSDLFGDDSIGDFDHERLWSNVVTWAAGGAHTEPEQDTGESIVTEPAWNTLKDAVSRLRGLQSGDGSIENASDEAAELVRVISEQILVLAPRFPYDKDYLEAVVADFGKWADNGFGVPDFLDSLVLFRPETQRIDGREHLVVFPMYTQNGNPDRNVEAVVLRTFWPDWLAELESARYDNPMFVPITFVDFTEGYDTNSAVLFPETVAVREVPKFTWGGIFCDREAARFRAVGSAAAQTLRLALPPDAARLLADQRLAQNTYVLWDLIHDRTHSHGDLPFDPFMIKQRMPYWMYAIEELRCDLNAFREAIELERSGNPYGKLVQYAILFDRLFRFPITGDRVKNYDGLGGQLLFAYLRKAGVLAWTDNTLRVDWTALPSGVLGLCEEVEQLYSDGIDRSRMAHWMAAHELMSGYVAAHPASVWAKGIEALPTDGPPRKMVDEVLPDEFPLNTFYEALRKKLKTVVASTAGITA
ncbi:DUF6421 family protein [Sciscionella sediminilitoris]|uniref:DUF6421 family protein n=1 Tax=Sciscionella sediminilitoris TaxID=1445613 RepID=UPI00068D3485|nr:DUF6421 family protein [Sciscionella sp. SE31]